MFKVFKESKFIKKNYEIIVVDDYSKDFSLNEIKNIIQVIKIIRNKNNLGLPFSLNKGIKDAKGTLIVRVDLMTGFTKIFLTFSQLFYF